MNKGGFSFDFRVFDKHLMKLVKAAVPTATERGLFKAAAEFLRDADNDIPQTPKLYGDLRGSKKIENPVITFSELSIQVGYDIEYAAYQHEGQREDGSHRIMFHTTTKGVKMPGTKFLQSKMPLNKSKYIKIIADTIKGVLS